MPTAVMAKQLLEQAQSGEMLEARDRRLVVAYLRSQDPNITQKAMSEIFKVTDTTIRNDLAEIARELTGEAKKDFIDRIGQDLIAFYEQHASEYDRGRRAAKLGTAVHRGYLDSSLNARIRIIEALQNLGIISDNPEENNQRRVVYKVETGPTGRVEVHKMKPEEVEIHFSEGPEIVDHPEADEEDESLIALIEQDNRKLAEPTA